MHKHTRICLDELTGYIPRDHAGPIEVTYLGRPDSGGYVRGQYYGAGIGLYEVSADVEIPRGPYSVSPGPEYRSIGRSIRAVSINLLRYYLRAMYPDATVDGRRGIDREIRCTSHRHLSAFHDGPALALRSLDAIRAATFVAGLASTVRAADRFVSQGNDSARQRAGIRGPFVIGQGRADLRAVYSGAVAWRAMESAEGFRAEVATTVAAMATTVATVDGAKPSEA